MGEVKMTMKTKEFFDKFIDSADWGGDSDVLHSCVCTLIEISMCDIFTESGREFITELVDMGKNKLGMKP